MHARVHCRMSHMCLSCVSQLYLTCASGVSHLCLSYVSVLCHLFLSFVSALCLTSNCNVDFKVTHMGRRQGQQELADAGVDIETIKRWCKYIYDEQSLSYILHIPLEPLLQRAGYDPKHPEKAIAAHNTVFVGHLVGMLLPKLVQYEREVSHAFQACDTYEKAKQQRLFVARGFYRHLRLCVQTFIQCAAAR